MSSDIVAPDAHNSGDIAALDALAPASRGVRPVRSGAWSDPGTWGGAIPAGGSIVIPAGVGVIVDARLSSVLESVRVDGCLEFARAIDTRLRTDLLYIAPGGEIWIGSPSAPISANVSAEVSFPPSGAINVASDPKLFGKGFVSASKTSIYGAGKTSRVRAATAPLEGATTIALATAPTEWRVGDRVVLTGTRWVKFLAVNGIRRADGAQDEELTLTAINGSSVTVTPALKFDHDGPSAEFMPYLVNFSRNVRFVTENAASIPVHERAHAMFMSPQTTIRSAEFNQMGRTDKSRRAVAVSSLTTVLADSNIKGRYPVHLHKAGGHGSGLGTDVRNIAVWGSPGWGITQHSGAALLYDNAVYNAFGSSFVAESGDEQGAWVSNIAIKSEGVAEIVKDADSVAAFDLGRTGDGYWLQGRLLHLHANVAAGMGGGVGFVYMHRGTDIAEADPIEPDMALQPSSFRFVNLAHDHPNIQQFTDNEVFASALGFHVVKFNPRQPHDGRSVIDRFTAWEVGAGIELTYVSGYTIKNATLVGARLRPSSIGVDFGENTFDAAVADSRIEDFDYGVNFAHLWTTTFGPAAFYISSNNSFQNIAVAAHLNADANDIILAAPPAPQAPAVAYSWGSSLPVWAGANGFRTLTVSGVKTDAAGSVPFPLVSGEFEFSNAGIEALLAQYGYYTLPDSRRVAVAPEHISNRLTGDIDLDSLVFEIDPTFSISAYRDNGVLDLAAAAPAAADDSAIVQRNGAASIDVLANDGAGGPFTVLGMAPARKGATQIEANGAIRYVPYPDATGVDSFSYWVRSATGRVAEADVSITIQ